MVTSDDIVLAWCPGFQQWTACLPPVFWSNRTFRDERRRASTSPRRTIPPPRPGVRSIPWLDDPRTDTVQRRLPPPPLWGWLGGDGAASCPSAPRQAAWRTAQGLGRRTAVPGDAPDTRGLSPPHPHQTHHAPPTPSRRHGRASVSCGARRRQGRRRDTATGDHLGAHQELAAGRTAFRVGVTPLGTHGLPVETGGHGGRRLPQLRPTNRQSVSVPRMVEAP